MDVSIIIVNYNTKELLINCINSIYTKTYDISFEIIVSDNGSTDNSKSEVTKKFPNVIYIENKKNLGFGTANNRGLNVASGKYIFYLNSDTIIKNNAVKIFFDFFEEKSKNFNIGALGCNLLDLNNNINSSYTNFPNINNDIINLIKCNYGLTKLFFLKLLGKHLPDTSKKRTEFEKKLGDVDVIIGADLFLKNDEYARFDENYFLYCEETDLQFQLNRVGKKRILIDGPEIIHLEGQSSKNHRLKYFEELTSFSSKCNNLSKIYFYKKNISKNKAYIIKLLTIILWCQPLIIKHQIKWLPKLLKR